jgi:hypothetical protein
MATNEARKYIKDFIKATFIPPFIYNSLFFFLTLIIKHLLVSTINKQPLMVLELMHKRFRFYDSQKIHTVLALLQFETRSNSRKKSLRFSTQRKKPPYAPNEKTTPKPKPKADKRKKSNFALSKRIKTKNKKEINLLCEMLQKIKFLLRSHF